MGKVLKTLKISEERTRWRTVLRALLEKKKSFYFHKPVDPIALNIPHYTTVIQRPMDLGTIGRMLDDGEYRSWETFSVDVRLVFTNAMTFNRDPLHQVHAAAKSLLMTFECKRREILEGGVVPKRRGGNPEDVDQEAVERKRATLRDHHHHHHHHRPRGVAVVEEEHPASPRRRQRPAAVSRDLGEEERQQQPSSSVEDDDEGVVGMALSSEEEEDDDDDEEDVVVDGMVPVAYVNKLGRRMREMQRRMEDLKRTLENGQRGGGPHAKRFRLRVLSPRAPASGAVSPDSSLSPQHEANVEISPEEERAYLATCIVEDDDDDLTTPRQQPAAKVTPRAGDDAVEPSRSLQPATLSRSRTATPEPVRRPRSSASPAQHLFDLDSYSTSPLWVMDDSQPENTREDNIQAFAA